MDIINKFISSFGFSKIIEGDCFDEKIHESNKYNPLVYIEVYRRQLVIGVIGLLLLLLGFYIMYGDEADGIISNTIDNASGWISSLVLGNYLTSNHELKVSKSLDLPIKEDMIEIDESLLSPF